LGKFGRFARFGAETCGFPQTKESAVRCLDRVARGIFLRDVNCSAVGAVAFACCVFLAARAAHADADLRSLEGTNLSLRMGDVLDMRRAQPRAVALPGAPMGNDYRIGAEDLIEIQVFGVDQLSRTVRVNSLGSISLPLIGSLALAGLTAHEAEGAIASRLAASYLQDPQVSLFIKEYTTQRVTVEGAVNKPGIYPLRGQTTLLRTLAMAGGQASLSDMNEVMVFRALAGGTREAQSYDVEKIRRGELDDPLVLSDDVVVVNRSKVRTIFKDSIFRDVIDAVNPFSPLMPH
jgi:polysaccharide export outer membrane protein